MKSPKLDKLGADPEFLVTKLDDADDYELDLQHAAQVFNTVGGQGTVSFIGVDGHSSTGELRPPPCRNVNNLVMYTGTGLKYADNYLKKHHSGSGLWARPCVGTETAGGHIHISFTYDDPLLYKVVFEHGYMPSGEDFLQYPNLARKNLDSTTINECKQRQIDWPTPYNFAAILSYLVEPFEYWIQPWHSRQRRNRNYGNAYDVRITYRDPADRRNKVGYFQYEYRLPSTWLAHPVLAYCYLGLAKLCFLNWDQLMDLTLEPRRSYWDSQISGDSLRLGAKEGLAKFQQLFWDRYGETGLWKRSADLSFLTPNLEWLRANRSKLWNPTQGVDMGKWSQIVELGDFNVPNPTYFEDLPDDPPAIAAKPPKPEITPGGPAAARRTRITAAAVLTDQARQEYIRLTRNN